MIESLRTGKMLEFQVDVSMATVRHGLDPSRRSIHWTEPAVAVGCP
jgi:hypothetical protein